MRVYLGNLTSVCSSRVESENAMGLVFGMCESSFGIGLQFGVHDRAS